MEDRVFTLEADGAPILCFPAGTHREAQSLLKEAWLLSDLRTVKARDKPVWDGQAKLSVRHATPRKLAGSLERGRTPRRMTCRSYIWFPCTEGSFRPMIRNLSCMNLTCALAILAPNFPGLEHH